MAIDVVLGEGWGIDLRLNGKLNTENQYKAGFSGRLLSRCAGADERGTDGWLV